MFMSVPPVFRMRIARQAGRFGQTRFTIAKISRWATAGLVGAALLLGAGARAADPPPAAAPTKVTIYSSFDRARLAPVLPSIGRETGLELVPVGDDDDLLLGRLLREGAGSPADIVLLPNAARFERAATAGLLQPLKLPAI